MSSAEGSLRPPLSALGGPAGRGGAVARRGGGQEEEEEGVLVVVVGLARGRGEIWDQNPKIKRRY